MRAADWFDDERGVASFDGVVIYSDPLSTVRHDRVMPLWPEEHLLTHAVLSDHVRTGHSVLDIGTGSGVFAIHAARAGARVLAVDCNLRAIGLALENARRNDITASLCDTLPDVGQISFRHDFVNLQAGKRLKTGDVASGFDVVIITPPYTLSYSPVSPALHAEAGEDGQAVFRNMAETAVSLLSETGVLICNQMSTVTPDGRITAVEFLKEQFRKRHRGVEIELAQCLPELQFSTEVFLRGQYATLLAFSATHDPTLYDEIERYIRAAATKWPRLALFSLSAVSRKNGDATTPNADIARAVAKKYHRTWDDRVALHEKIVSTSVPPRAHSLPDVRAPVRDITSAQWGPSDDDGAGSMRQVRHAALRRLGFDLDSLDPGPDLERAGIDLVVVDAAPISQNVMGYSGLTQEVTVWFSKRLRDRISEDATKFGADIATAWQENTRFQQKTHTGPFLHPWFTGAASASDWALMQHSVRLRASDGLMEDAIAAPAEWFSAWSKRISRNSVNDGHLGLQLRDEMEDGIALFEGPLQQLQVSEPMSVAAEIVRSSRLEALFALPRLNGREKEFAELKKDLLRAVRQDGLDVLRALPALSPSARTLAVDMLSADADYCHLRMHHALDDSVRRVINDHAPTKWSSLAGVPLRIREITEADRTRGLPEQYRGGVWIYMASMFGGNGEPDRQLEQASLRAAKALWLNYLDRFALKSAHDLVQKALHHNAHQLAHFSSALAQVAVQHAETPKLLTDGTLVLAANLRLFQTYTAHRNQLRDSVQMERILDCAYLAAVVRLHERTDNYDLTRALARIDQFDDEKLIQNLRSRIDILLEPLPENWEPLLKEARFVVLLFHAAWQAFFHAAEHQLTTNAPTKFGVRFEESKAGALEVTVSNTGAKNESGVRPKDADALAAYTAGLDNTRVQGPFYDKGEWRVVLTYERSKG